MKIVKAVRDMIGVMMQMRWHIHYHRGRLVDCAVGGDALRGRLRQAGARKVDEHRCDGSGGTGHNYNEIS
jgi:hypothetical protein